VIKIKQLEFSNREIYILYYWLGKLREENPLYYGNHSKTLFDKINNAFQEIHDYEMKKIIDFKQEYNSTWIKE
jgi:uncharacterized protein involved in tolerance to divalent cations